MFERRDTNGGSYYSGRSMAEVRAMRRKADQQWLASLRKRHSRK